MDLKLFLEQFLDYMVPRLDPWEQTLYLYIFRRTYLQGHPEATLGLKSARRSSLGLGLRGKGVSETTVYGKLRNLEKKGCISIVDSTRNGTTVRLHLPAEIPGMLPEKDAEAAVPLESMDFFAVPENRLAILRRENHSCFYCHKRLSDQNYVVEHVVSRPTGDNTYRNVVAAYRSCNNKKGNNDATDFVRTLYREGYLSDTEFESRLTALRRLSAGELKPDLSIA